MWIAPALASRTAQRAPTRKPLIRLATSRFQCISYGGNVAQGWFRGNTSMRICILLIAVLTLTFAMTSGARAQSVPTFWADMSGSCKLLMLAGRVEECRGASLMHQQFDNGRANFTVAMFEPSVNMIGFSGGQLLRPNSDELRLIIDRILLNLAHPAGKVVTVRGECLFRGDMSQAVPQELRCSTREGAVYQLVFVTDAKPAKIILR